MTRRTRRSVAGSVLVVLGLVIGAVVATALRAEGRERSRADTNDGGAWLLKRDAGYIGHVNRLVGEVTAVVSVADPGSDYDVDQAAGIIVVHDRTTGLVTTIDDSVSRVANPAGVRVGADVSVHAVVGGALIVDRATMGVWKLDREQLLTVASTDEVDPLLTGDGAAASAATPDGHVVLADIAAGRVVFLRPDGTTERSPEFELTDGVVSISSLGPDTAVLADTDGDLVLATKTRAESLAVDVLGADGEPSPVVLQQPGSPADEVVAATVDGRIVAVPLDAAAPGRDRSAGRDRADSPDRLRRLRVRRVDRAGDVHAVVRRRRRRVDRGPAGGTRRRRLGAAAAARQRLGVDQRRRHGRGVGDQPPAAPRPDRRLGQHPVAVRR